MFDAVEALEIMITGIYFAIEFEGKGGKMCIGGQISGRAGGAEQIAQNEPVFFAGHDGLDVGLCQPRVEVLEGSLGREGMSHDSRVGYDSKECQDHTPCQADVITARQDLLEPSPRGIMMGRCRIDRINQQVGVDQNHFLSRSLPAISMVSISSASRNALSMLIPGSTPPRDAGLIL